MQQATLNGGESNWSTTMGELAEYQERQREGRSLRCNRTAAGIASNGFRACLLHCTPEITEPYTPESDNYLKQWRDRGRCDHRVTR